MVAAEGPSKPVMKCQGHLRFGAIAALGLGIGACTPTVRVEPPREPITVNLNIKLDAEVRVVLEEQARNDIERNKDIF